MWSLAKGYMEQRYVCEVDYYWSWEYLKPNNTWKSIWRWLFERKQSQTS